MKTIKFLLLLAGFFVFAGAAADPPVNLSGVTGSCTWSLTTGSSGLTLTISGSGAILRLSAAAS